MGDNIEEYTNNPEAQYHGLEIAIIGMAGRFPGAQNLEEFWQNLRHGVESISFFTDEALAAAGVDAGDLHDPDYVKAGAVLDDVEMFAAAFFGYTPKEAAIMDPQQRLFLECVWTALEHAGYAPENYKRPVGVFAGATTNTYLLFNLASNPELVNSLDHVQIDVANGAGFLTTRVSYKLDLTGPSHAVQSACSTSLVAVHTACQSLLNGECDMALAGGAAVNVRQARGYRYLQGGIVSPDGHCRAFDAAAQGTVFGSGVGVVVLKRLEDAVAEGDTIHAVIRGSAVNNDGARKVGYTAPGVSGQARVITEALAAAGVEAETITYVEAHGTGTALGDPIEVEALTQSFRAGTAKKRFCGLGSVKTNIGHLDVVAGVAGLIKTVLALKHKEIPPSLHFEQPNPKIDFENSPFYVNTALSRWQVNGMPRRAGVSSFGLGGTNAHVVLEEAPPVAQSGPSRPWQLLALSAKTAPALEAVTANLASHLKQHPTQTLADVAYTLHVGRSAFDHRRMVVGQDTAAAITALETGDPPQCYTHSGEIGEQPIVFMFSGQGAQYVNMALELYQAEPLFRRELDRCAHYLRVHHGLDLLALLYPQAADDEASRRLAQTAHAQPALFAMAYALARLWLSWGVQPQAMIGHSIGEYVAACLAGVFSLQEALSLVAARGRLMQEVPAGAMLAVPLPESEVALLLGTELSLAAVNGPTQCVISGPGHAIAHLEQRLSQEGVVGRRLHTSHAFHSAMMAPVAGELAALVAKVRLSPPQIPYISNLTGDWITAADATDPEYWAKQLRQTVRFAEGLQTLLQEDRILLEVGPGTSLSRLAKRHPLNRRARLVATSLRHPRQQHSDVAYLLTTLGKLWLSGTRVDWNGFYANEKRVRVPLPSYPFERQRYWIEARQATYRAGTSRRKLAKNPRIVDWLYMPSWKRVMPPHPAAPKTAGQAQRWLLFTGDSGLGSRLGERLEEAGQHVVVVESGGAFRQIDERRFTLDPHRPHDYQALLQQLQTADHFPDKIVHLWNVTPASDPLSSEDDSFAARQALGFYSLLFLAQALDRMDVTTPCHITVVANDVYGITAEEVVCPQKAPLLAPCIVIPQEYPHIVCRYLDIVLPASGSPQQTRLVAQLMAELLAQPADAIVAYRGRQCWVPHVEPVPANDRSPLPSSLRQNGVYLIIGGMAGIGPALASYLARAAHARLVLVEAKEFSGKASRMGETAVVDEPPHQASKIAALLKEAGAEACLVLEAAITNLEEMQDVIAQTVARFGQMNGVIYAAGFGNEEAFKAIPQVGAQESKQQFGRQRRGLAVLEKVLANRPLDFCLVTSSLAAILGGLGSLVYTATARFTDAFIRQHNQANPAAPWLGVNWDAWQAAEEASPAAGSQRGTTPLSLTAVEGEAVFQRILATTPSDHIIVSVADLAARTQQWLGVGPAQEMATPQENPSPETLHPRPKLQTTYVAPRTALEQTIARVWQEVLGIEEIGIDDNFFDLGGDSLIGVQVISQLRKVTNKKVAVTSLYEKLTIKALAELLAESDRDGSQISVQDREQIRKQEERIMKRKQRQKLQRLQQKKGDKEK